MSQLSERYGRGTGDSVARDAKKTKQLRIAFAAFMVLLVAGTVWIGLFQSNRDVSGSIPRFDITSDSSVSMQVEIRKESDQEAACTLRSRGKDGAEVGRKEVRFPKGGSDVTRTEVLQTTARAVTAEVEGCHAVE